MLINLAIIAMLVTNPRCIQSMSLRPVVSASGSPFCGLGNPSIVVSTDDIVGIEMGVPGVARCAYQCVAMSSRTACAGFNYIYFLPSSGLCQFFSNYPNYCDTKVPGCRFYEVSTVSQSSSCTRSLETQPRCSFPFTYQGQLYYQCIDFQASTGPAIGCLFLNTMQLNVSAVCNAASIAVKQPEFQTMTIVGTRTPSTGNNCSSAVIGTLNKAWWGIDLGQQYDVTLVNATNYATFPVSGLSRPTNVSQWVQSVIAFSSHYPDPGWSANQVIGPPNVYPRYGDLQYTWAPDCGSLNEYIIVQFAKSVIINSIELYETNLPGAVVNILSLDMTFGKWISLWTAPGMKPIKLTTSRIFTPVISVMPYLTNQVKLTLDTSANVNTWYELDAIQVNGMEQSLDSFVAWVSSAAPVLTSNDYSVCNRYNGIPSSNNYSFLFTCSTNLTQIRYIILQTAYSNSSLCLDEVQVRTGSSFVSRNTTLNVSISTVGIVPLRSVNGWLTIMSRVDSTFPVNLTWTLYKVGFGDIMSNFWLGLERIFQLTNMNTNGQILYRLRFEVQSAATRGWYSEEYDWFYIDSETQFYTLHTSLTATGDAGDSINSAFQPGANSNGMPFSSKDADHDQSSINCAATYLGGWWYNGCSSSKQLGTASSNFMWNSLCKVAPAVAPDGGLLASRMMIKPIA